ncbi:MAG: glycosyl hydrolase [Candidatus Hydrogenedentales bacterium]|jgi:hypothetical protein
MIRIGTKWTIAVALTLACLTVGIALAAEPADLPMPTPAVLTADARPVAEKFASPGHDGRILKIIHNFPDEPEAQVALLDKLSAQGFGGVVANVSFTEYLLSEPRWTAFIRAVGEARKRGMMLWLYDECGYPSGSAGGVTLKDHPELEARGVYVADAVSSGGAVAVDVPPGDVMRAAAYPVKDGIAQLDQAVDLAASIKDGKLSWEAPAGEWRVLVFTQGVLYKGTHAEWSLAYKFPYINLLQPEATARFIDVTHAEYARRMGDNLGTNFVATFTDEPSLMSVFLREQPYSVLPWSPGLADEFAKRRGYPLDTCWPSLTMNTGPQGLKARYDFWQTVGELVSENFFGQLQTWGRQHGVLSGGHLLCEEKLLWHVPFYGDFFKCARRLDAPSIDCLTSLPEEVPWYIARLLSSVAELEGRTVTMSETSDHSQHYRAKDDTRPAKVVTEAEIRGTCNKQMANGITTITSYYSFQDLDDAALTRLNEWVGRCSNAIRGGHQVADIAVVYPTESMWLRFTPSREWVKQASPEADRLDRVFREAGNYLYKAGRDFTFVDSQAIMESTSGEGALRHGELAWRVVVLPDTDTLPLKAWENLAAFYRAGGAVIALTSKPANSETEFPSPRVAELANEIFGDAAEPQTHRNDAGGCGVFLPEGKEDQLAKVIDSLLDRDVKCGAGESPIHSAHRRIDGREVYFLINDSREAWEGSVTFAATGAGEQWDPATGKIAPCPSATDVPVKLEPFGGIFYIFATAQMPARRSEEPGLQ